MEQSRMSVLQLTLFTSLCMMGAGIIMLPTKLASLGMVSMLSWIITGTGAAALAYVFAQCGMFSRRRGGMGGFAEYAFGRTGSFLTNYAYGVSLLIGNVAIALASVNYGLSAFKLDASPETAVLSTIGLLWVATGLNFLSPRFTGRVTAVIIWALLLPLMVLVAAGPFWFSADIYASNWNPAGRPVWEVMPESFTMMFWAFLGIESACANAEAVNEPKKNVPRAVLAATFITAFFYFTITNVIAGIVPNDELAFTAAPIGVVYARMMGEAAMPAVSALLWLGCAGSLLTWQFTMGRVFRSSAEVGYFPQCFARVNSRNSTVLGLVILTLFQTALALLTLFHTSFLQYERLSDLAVHITLFAYVLCMGGSYAMSRAEGLVRERMRRIDLAAAVALCCIFLTLFYLDGTVSKMSCFLVFIGFVLFCPAVCRRVPAPGMPKWGASQ